MEQRDDAPDLDKDTETLKELAEQVERERESGESEFLTPAADAAEDAEEAVDDAVDLGPEDVPPPPLTPKH